MLQFISNLRIKIITLFLILNLVGFSYPCYSEQLLNQDIDISSGSTVSHSTQVIQQLTGGPYTINNEGTIEASNITSHAEAILFIHCRYTDCTWHINCRNSVKIMLFNAFL